MANSNPRAHGVGRKPGVPNKTTTIAREVVTRFVEGNLDKLQEWLDQVANGVWDAQEGKWVVRPDPAKAYGMLLSLLEYHIPKLHRVEMDLSADISIKTFNVRRVLSSKEHL